MSNRPKRWQSVLVFLLSALMVLTLPGPGLVRAEETPLIQENSAPIAVNNAAYGDYWTLNSDGNNEHQIFRTQPWFYKAQHGAYGELKDCWMSGNSEGGPAYDPPLGSDGKGEIKLWERAGVSNIAFTVTGTGQFYFEYRATPNQQATSPPGPVHSGIYVKINEPVTLLNALTYVFRSTENQFGPTVMWGAPRPGWLNTTIEIREDHLIDGHATIYIANMRATKNVVYDEDCAIANVAFYPDETPEVNLNLNIENHAYGSVTIGSTVYSDANQEISFSPASLVSLTATPNQDGQFYGWKDEEGKFVKTDADLSFTITDDRTVTAVFAPEGHFNVIRNSQGYYAYYNDDNGGLHQAMEDAESGDFIYLLGDYALDDSLTVPQGVTLYVPFRDGFRELEWEYDTDNHYSVADKKGYADGTLTANSHFTGSANLASAARTFRTLTIDEEVTLTVNGTLLVGSVISYPSQQYQGHTSGWHGKIVNNGNIVIKNGGTLNCWGFITGAGTVEAENGSKVYEPFMVLDFSGGNNSLKLFEANQSPFKQYAMQNIQSTLVLLPGSTLYAHCNLYANSVYNKTDAVFVGPQGVFEPAVGASLTRTYNGAKNTVRNPDIGVMTYTFDGGMTMRYMSLQIMIFEITTEDLEFPIPQTMNLVLTNGDYDVRRVKFMPGSSVRVEEGAHLDVSHTLYFLDGLIQSDIGGDRKYSTTEDLKAKGYSGAANLIVNGSMTVKSGAKFGGIIQTEAPASNPASIVFGQGAILDNPGVIDGARGYSATNKSIFDLPARAYFYDRANKEFELIELEAGKEYRSYGATEWVIENYEMDYATPCGVEDSVSNLTPSNEPTKYYKWTHATVALGEDRIGSWSLPFDGYTVNVTKGTTNDANDATKALIEVDEEVPEGESLVFTVTSTPAGIGYVHLVTYQLGEGPSIILSPEDGEYTIGNVQNNISIQVTSCLLGDLNGSGNINNLDLVQMRKILAGGYQEMTPIKSLAADLTQDGKINNLDLVRLRKVLV